MDNRYNAYGKYAGMVFQMAAIILLFVWAGRKLDLYLQLKQAYFTALLALLGVLISVWQVIKSISKIK